MLSCFILLSCLIFLTELTGWTGFRCILPQVRLKGADVMYTFNKELKMLNRAAEEFARKQLVADREENDKYPFGLFFDTVLKKAFELDFFHTMLPEEYGGIGQDMEALCILLDNICQADASLAAIMFTSVFAQELIIQGENFDLLKKHVNNADKAEDFIIAFPVFNNPLEIKQVAGARQKGDKYLISGSVEYLVMAGISSYALIPVEIEPAENEKGISFFLVNLTDSGVKKSEPILSLGIHACPAVDLELKDVEGVLIGEPGKGGEYFTKVCDKMNIAACAMSLGIMKGSFKEGLEYSKKRMQGGKKIIEWSEMQMILAEMAIQIKIAEMLISRACQALNNKEKEWEKCAGAAAVHIQKSACDLTTDGVQILGGVGYMKDFGQEKRFRDAKQLQALMGLWPMKKLRKIYI
jgi:alkylation response protein AidB-like acyl-CoA dehydrogenase